MQLSRVPTASGALAVYLSEIGQYPILPVEKEQELARLYQQTGSARAAQTLVTSNLRFVVKLAFEFRSYGLNLGDLIQEGNIGLMRAVKKFDPDRHIRLITYAAWWIRAQLRQYILKTWSLVRIGTTRVQRGLFFSLRKAQRELALKSDGAEGAASIDGVARALQVLPSDVQQMETRIHQRDFSLDTPLVEDGDATHLEGVEGQAEPADACLAAKEEAAMLSLEVDRALQQLDERERFIVVHRLMAEPRQSLQQLGTHFGVSRERARQLEARAKAKLRSQLQGLADQVQLASAA